MAQVSSPLHLHHDIEEEVVTLESLPDWGHPDFDLNSSKLEYLTPSDIHHLSAVRFPDDVLESNALIADGPDLFDRRENQVNFVMDLFQQRVEQSQVLSVDSDSAFISDSDHLNDSVIGVIEGNCEVGHLDLDFGLGLGFGVLDIRDTANSNNNNNTDTCDNNNLVHVLDGHNNSCGFVIEDIDNDDEDFFDERRVSGEVGPSGLRVIGIGSDSDSEDENGIEVALTDVVMRPGEDEYVDENDHDDGMGIPLCWDSLQLEDNRETNEDFEWEEVDARVDEVLSMFIDDNDDGNSTSLSISPIIPPEDVVSVERGGFENLEWEVLLNASNLETTPEIDNNNESFFGEHDGFIHTAEYELLFGQFVENENAWMGHPPASKSVVENLAVVVLTQEDVDSNNALCAVCKDEIGVGEKAKQLPCAHQYHGECIIPWLGIRNTCPVCRYELPTGEAGYERRTQRAARGL